MAKDPAFLFYPKDFLGGSIFLNHEQMGKLIHVLCAQHQTGHLTGDQLNSITGNDPGVNKKFIEDSDGLWYNERLEEEIEKRKTFRDLQAQRASERWKKIKKDTAVMPRHKSGIDPAMPEGNADAIENENEDRTETRNEGTPITIPTAGLTAPESFTRPTLDEVAAYCRERKNHVDPQQWYAHYQSNGWKIGNTPMADWQAAVQTWEHTGFANFSPPAADRAEEKRKEAQEVAAERKVAQQRQSQARSPDDDPEAMRIAVAEMMAALPESVRSRMKVGVGNTS